MSAPFKFATKLPSDWHTVALVKVELICFLCCSLRLCEQVQIQTWQKQQQQKHQMAWPHCSRNASLSYKSRKRCLSGANCDTNQYVTYRLTRSVLEPSVQMRTRLLVGQPLPMLMLKHTAEKLVKKETKDLGHKLDGMEEAERTKHLKALYLQTVTGVVDSLDADDHGSSKG